MSRRYIGTWPDELPSEISRIHAIAALGVLVNVGRKLPLETVDQVFGALQSEFDNSYARRHLRYLSWGNYSESTFEDLKLKVKPAHAAEGWYRFIKTCGDVDLSAVSQYMDDRHAVESYHWLADLFWKSGSGVRSLSFDWWLNTKADSRRDFGRTAWHWPLRVGFLPDEASQTVLRAFYSQSSDWLRTLIQPVDLASTGQNCDLLLAPSGVDTANESLQRLKTRATAILLDQNRIDSVAVAMAWQRLSATANASAVAFLPRHLSLDLLTELVSQISHDLPFNVAVSEALRGSAPAPLVVGDHRFFSDCKLSRLGERWARRLDLQRKPRAQEMHELATAEYSSESGSASQLIRLVRDSGAEDPERRYLKAANWFFDEFPLRPENILRSAEAFAAKRWNLLEVSIAPLDEGKSSELEPIPLHDVDWTEEAQNLNVAVTIPDCDVVAIDGHIHPNDPEFRYEAARLLKNRGVQSVDGERRSNNADVVGISIRATGPSSAARFLLRPHSVSNLKGRILVLHANRILQTAIIEGRIEETPREQAGHDGTKLVDDGIRLLPEGTVRSSFQELNERRSFDLAFLTNDSLTGASQYTAIADDKVILRDFDEVREAAARIGKCLEEIIESPADFSKPGSQALIRLLINLAHEGVLIRDALVDAGLRPILDRDPTRLQVVTAKPDRILPLEMIYDGLAPDRVNAKLCPNQPQALHDGSCGNCPNRSGRHHVCAMRFWGVRKVIERQMYDEKKAPEKDYVTTTPSPQLERIGRAANRLFANSARAANFTGGPAAITALQRRLGAGSALLHSANRWNDWRNLVQQHSPTLLVILPHVDVSAAGEVLEIGEDDTITNAEVDAAVVGSTPKVIVLLLGCETASVQVRYANFVARFRQAKAAIVVGTIMPVRGRHAAPMAEALVEQLDQCWSEPFKVATMGDVMTLIRRRFMSQGLPAGLALVAFGDADWLLGGE